MTDNPEGSTMPNFDHDHHGNDSADHEFTTHTHGADVSVSKVGGGTVGKAYEGAWHYTIKVGDTVVAYGSNFTTVEKSKHEHVAVIIADIVAKEQQSPTC